MCMCQSYGKTGVPNARGFCLVCGERVDCVDDPHDFLARIHDPLVKRLLFDADQHSKMCGDNYIQRAGVWAELARRLAVLADERGADRVARLSESADVLKDGDDRLV